MRQLRGLEKICKLYGSLWCGGTFMVWDYANDVAVEASKMKRGSKRWKESEKAKCYPNLK